MQGLIKRLLTQRVSNESEIQFLHPIFYSKVREGDGFAGGGNKVDRKSIENPSMLKNAFLVHNKNY